MRDGLEGWLRDIASFISSIILQPASQPGAKGDVINGFYMLGPKRRGKGGNARISVSPSSSAQLLPTSTSVCLLSCHWFGFRHYCSSS